MSEPCEYIYKDGERYKGRCGSHAKNEQNGEFCDMHYYKTIADNLRAENERLKHLLDDAADYVEEWIGMNDWKEGTTPQNQAEMNEARLFLQRIRKEAGDA